MKYADLHADVKQRLRLWRRRLLWQRLLNTVAAIAVLLLIGHLLATPLSTLLQQVAAVGLVWFAQLWLSPSWRRLTPDNFVAHLNRRFPDFEESAQLLLTGTDKLTPLQILQRERVYAVYAKNLAQVERWRAPIRYRPALAVMTGCLLLAVFSDQLGSLQGRFLPENPLVSTTPPGSIDKTAFKRIAVRIEPPAYTGLAPLETDQLNIELPQGSRLEWFLDLETDADEYALQLSDGQQIALERIDDKHLHASAVIDKTDLYRITRTHAGAEQTVGEIYALTVKLDRAPDIRLIEPETAVLEIARNGPARFNSKALVKDDYGLDSVGILASVAKGSGEGVKFRDQKLTFDGAIDTGKGLVYQKEWDLKALGMEPGDEVYFTVIATDNRLPQANTARSETLIVRWLEDQQAVLGADGLGIDFIPEFFKSQRQIIIETEQLIADQPLLAAQAFSAISYAIGQAQADLKQKYGQYLGDEFGEGRGAQLSDAHEATEKTGEAHEHEHASAAAGGVNKSLNSTADIIRLYGHNHGDPEIGPITRRNPVALMKRAVSEMWQAERHLMQAEPELALPFEYEAYKYLKLARQADRIYVKRLGFEPPPVSEERRLSGQLDEIISYRLSAPEASVEADGKSSNQALLKDVYQILKIHSSEYLFNESERELLSRLSLKLTGWSQQQSELIQHAANLEKLSLAGRMKLASCEHCLGELETAIWNLIEQADTQLRHRNATWSVDDGLVKGYQQRLKQADAGQNAATVPTGDQQ